MKKIITILSLITAMFLLISCSTKPDISDIHDSPDLDNDVREAHSITKDNMIIVDNQNKEFVYKSARLVKPKDATKTNGNDYIKSANGESFSGMWKPTIKVSGYYKIYAIWPEVEEALSNVKVEVIYEGGSNQDTTKTLNQTINAGYWVFIGTYYMQAGNTDGLIIYGSEAGTVLADAAMFDLSIQIDNNISEPALVGTDISKSIPKVHLVRTKDLNHLMTIDGERFFANGICDVQKLEEMSKAGVNTARTYSIDALQDGKILDQALELGIKIVVGIWMNHETASFSYANNPELVQSQFEKIKGQINQYKNHPAILAWAVGNEVDKSTSENPIAIYHAINDIAKYIHEVDYFHPTMAVLAGSSPLKIGYIKRYAHHIDIIGINSYSNVKNVSNNLTGWKGPYMVTEYAVDQPMEIKLKTDWGAIIEPNSKDKADMYYERYQNYMLNFQNENVIGSFAFKDMGSFRVTHTWYGLLYSNLKTPQYYAMEDAWKQQARREVMYINNVTINDTNQTSNLKLEALTNAHIMVDVFNPSLDTLTFSYEVRRDVGLSTNTIPSVLKEFEFGEDVKNSNGIYMSIPQVPGNYRLFVYATNEKGDISTFSYPFKIIGEAFIIEEQPGVIIVSCNSKEGYYENGNYSNSTNLYYNKELTRFTRDSDSYAEFSPTLNDGKYRLYYYNLSEGMYEHDDSQMQIDINHSGGVESIVLNVTSTPAGWVYLGDFDMNSLDSHVTINKILSGNKVVRSTAVAFLPIK